MPELIVGAGNKPEWKALDAGCLPDEANNQQVTLKCRFSSLSQQQAPCNGTKFLNRLWQSGKEVIKVFCPEMRGSLER